MACISMKSYTKSVEFIDPGSCVFGVRMGFYGNFSNKHVQCIYLLNTCSITGRIKLANKYLVRMSLETEIKIIKLLV